MALWYVEHYDHSGNLIEYFEPINLSYSIVRNDENILAYEIALSDPSLTRDGFAPYRTDWGLFRDSVLIDGGLHTSRNLSLGQDSVIVGGKSWMHYLKKRYYPFDPVAYISTDYVNWPKQWPTQAQIDASADPVNFGIDPKVIINDIMNAMMAAEATYGITFSLPSSNLGYTTRKKIYPGDQTTVYDHIRGLSEVDPGFDFRIDENKLLRLNTPGFDDGTVLWTLYGDGDVGSGGVVSADWTDNGPIATYTIGYGAGMSVKRGSFGGGLTGGYLPSIQTFRRTELPVDFGTIATQQELDAITGAESHKNRAQDKSLQLAIAHVARDLPGFWGLATVVGRRLHFIYDWGYHKVDADFLINRVTINVDNHGNEEASFELERVYD